MISHGNYITGAKMPVDILETLLSMYHETRGYQGGHYSKEELLCMQTWYVPNIASRTLKFIEYDITYIVCCQNWLKLHLEFELKFNFESVSGEI